MARARVFVGLFNLNAVRLYIELRDYTLLDPTLGRFFLSHLAAFLACVTIN